MKLAKETPLNFRRGHAVCVLSFLSMSVLVLGLRVVIDSGDLRVENLAEKNVAFLTEWLYIFPWNFVRVEKFVAFFTELL